MKKLLTLFTFALLLTSLTVAAQQASNSLVVWTKDGSSLAFTLSEKPKVTFSETELLLTTGSLSISYPLRDMKMFTYQVPDGITRLLADGSPFVLEGETLLFPSLKEGSTVALHTPDGALVTRSTVRNSGEYALPLSHIGPGVYMVTVNGHSYKIKKK